MRKKYSLTIIAIVLQFGCTNSQDNKHPVQQTEPEKKSYTPQSEDSESENACGFSDNTYNATVDYSNPETGYSATYTLDVEVSGCQVIQIDFPNGGYLDDDHIDPTDLDENGDASVEDDKGRTFDVHIDESNKDDDNKSDDNNNNDDNN